MERRDIAKRLLGSALLAGLLALQLPALVRSAAAPRKPLPDFFQDWGTARNHAAGQPIYGDQPGAARRHLGAEWPADTPLFKEGSTRPPSAAWLTLPLARLEFHQAFCCWNALSALALAAVVGMLAMELPPRSRGWALLPALAGLAFWDAVGWGFREGQWSLFLAALGTLAWQLARRGWFGWAGVAVGVAGAIKLFPLLLAALFLPQGRRRGLWTAALAFGGLNAAALATFGPTAFLEYTERVAPQLAPWRGSALNVSLPALPHRLFAPLDRQDTLFARPWFRSPPLAEALGLVASAAVVGLWLWRLPRLGHDAAWSAGLLALLLAAPLAWGHYLVLALLPLWRWLRANPPWPARVLVCMSLWLPPTLLLHRWLPDAGAPPLLLGPWASATLLALPTYGLLWLFAAALRGGTVDAPGGEGIMRHDGGCSSVG